MRKREVAWEACCEVFSRERREEAKRRMKKMKQERKPSFSLKGNNGGNHTLSDLKNDNNLGIAPTTFDILFFRKRKSLGNAKGRERKEENAREKNHLFLPLADERPPTLLRPF